MGFPMHMHEFNLSRVALATVLTLYAHGLIWLGNSFVAGAYPALTSFFISADNALRPIGVALLLAWLTTLVLAIQYWLKKTSPQNPLTRFMGSRQYWYRVFLVMPTTGLFLMLHMPVVIRLAGPFSPAVIESANLFTVWVLTLATMPVRLTLRQKAVQLVWLAAMIGGSITFMMLLTGNAARAESWAQLVTPQMVVAVGVSIMAHAVFWIGAFFEFGHFPRIQRAVFGREGNNLPRGWVWLLVTIVFAFYGWLTLGNGAWNLYPAQVAESLTDPGFLARLEVFLLAGQLPIIMAFPLLVFFATPYTPIFIGGGNVVVMFALITLGQGGISLSLQSLAALTVLVVTAVGFSWVMSQHQKANAKP